MTPEAIDGEIWGAPGCIQPFWASQRASTGTASLGGQAPWCLQLPDYIPHWGFQLSYTHNEDFFSMERLYFCIVGTEDTPYHAMAFGSHGQARLSTETTNSQILGRKQQWGGVVGKCTSLCTGGGFLINESPLLQRKTRVSVSYQFTYQRSLSSVKFCLVLNSNQKGWEKQGI